MARAIIIILILLLIKPLFISLDVVYSMSSEPNATAGFSIDLIHIDSAESPYYDSSLSQTQTLLKGLRRSLDRFRWLNQSLSSGSGSTETDIERSIHSGNFLMRYQIGEQKVHSLGILDTGSNLIWTQCFPCEDCIKQSPPHYEPELSSTYKMVFCNENECTRSNQTFCSDDANLCLYNQSYSGGTSTTGQLSKDTFILASTGGTTTPITDIVFGCANEAKGYKFEGYLSGVIGLGPAPDSLLSQLGYMAKGKFSYCMVSQYENTKRSTRLNFGDYADVSGDGVVHIPLVIIPGRFSAYYVTLFALTIRGTKYAYLPSDGNLVVDSGASLTKLPNFLYNGLKDNLVWILSRWKIIKDPVKVLDLCFEVDHRIWVPTVTLHFDGGDLELGAHNMFVRTRHYSLCLAALPAGGGPAFLGNIAQGDFLVGYDNENKQVSFKPTNCTNFG